MDGILTLQWQVHAGQQMIVMIGATVSCRLKQSQY